MTSSESSDDANVVPDLPAETGEAYGVDENQEYLLNRLLYRGVLPRYAFPTDVASFYVFDVAKSTDFRYAYQFAPSQALSVALSQYAPNKEVWIANRLFRSGAIFSPGRRERVEAWRAKRLYYECSNCRFACTKERDVGTKGESIDCPACGMLGTLGKARYWFRPPGFAHPVDVPENESAEELQELSYATRAKLDAPSPKPGEGTWQRVGARVRGHYLRRHLLVTNAGPRHDGYTYCALCGRIEPTSPPTSKLSKPHLKPYPDSKKPLCPGGAAAIGVCLGSDFITDILLVSMRVDAPVRLTPGILATEIAMRTVCEAIAKATCIELELEDGEVQSDFRSALSEGGQSGIEVEVYLYDTLPGGAGFARRAGDRLPRILERASEVLAACSCDASCYNCLRSFKNKMEHDRLDRHIGRDLLEYLLRGTLPTLSAKRESTAVRVLAEDVARQAGSDVAAVVDSDVEVLGLGSVRVPLWIQGTAGQQLAVCVTHPLTPHTPADSQLVEVRELTATPVMAISELTVRRNLPSATQQVLSAIGEE